MVENVMPCGDVAAAGWARVAEETSAGWVTTAADKVSAAWTWVWAIEPFPHCRWASTRPEAAEEQLARVDPFILARGPF